MDNILVTGASGFVGSHLVSSLKREHQVFSLVHNNLRGKWQEDALSNTVQVTGDVRNVHLIKETVARFGINEVYHLSALPIVKTAYLDPWSVYGVNINGTVAVLEACRLLSVGRVLLLCTDKVYGDKVGASEEDKPEATEPYATSKICQRYIAESYGRTYGMNIVIAHACNIFGYDPYSDRIFPNAIRACIAGESPVIYTNDHSVRQYVYVEDVVEALRVLKSKHDAQGLYNMTTTWTYTAEQIVKKILEHFPSITPRYEEKPSLQPPLQISRSITESKRFDWSPRWTFDAAIKLTIDKFAKYKNDWSKQNQREDNL